MELYEEMQQLISLLDIALKEFKTRGREYAQAYKQYRMILAKELLTLKAEGMPVTIAYDIARGKEEVANAKEQEIITECLYKNCQEAINTYKLQIKVLQAQIDKEYSNEGKGNI